MDEQNNMAEHFRTCIEYAKSNGNGWVFVEVRHLETAMKLLCNEKKAVDVTSSYRDLKYGRCPGCGSLINSMDNAHSCGRCGQAVDWE